MNNDVSIRRSINGIDYDFRLTMSEMVAIYNEVSHRNMVSDIRQRLYERQEVNGYSFEELRTDEFMNAVAEVYDEEAHAQGGSFWQAIDKAIDSTIPNIVAIHAQAPTEEIPTYTAPKDTVPLYVRSFGYAALSKERDSFEKSFAENIRCAAAIDKAISEHYGGELTAEVLDSITEEYGADRVRWVLANTMQCRQSDSHFSDQNMEWAMSVNIPESDGNIRFCLESSASAVNRIADAACRTNEKKNTLANEPAEEYAELEDEEEMEM